jgi:hypothetical protein
MSDPPQQLDGATVVCWAISPIGEFYRLAGSEPPISVTAMAVCQYNDSGAVYLFKCDCDWNVVQDWDCGSVDEGTETATQHARGQPLRWHRFGEPGA